MDRLFLDIENVPGHPKLDDLLLVGFALNDEPVTVLDWFDFNTEHASSIETGRFLSLLASPDVVKVEQTKHDARFLALAGLDVDGPIHDTAVMAYTLNENTPLDIDWLAWRYAGLEMDKRLRRTAGRILFRADDDSEHDLAEWREWSGARNIDEHGLPRLSEAWLQFIDYNVRDVDALRRLYRKLWERLDESMWLPYFLDDEVPYTGVLMRMETRGLPVNLERTAELVTEMEPEVERLGVELLRQGGLPPSFNLNSGDQLANYLFSRVVTFTDTLVYDRETIECLKSCLDGEHDDCGQEFDFWEPSLNQMVTLTDWHVTDFLPEGFVLDKLGRDRVHGHWTVKGRGLKPTPPPKNPITGEVGKRPSTASPELLYMHADDDWVRLLCTEYRKLTKLLTTYLTKWPGQAVGGRLYGRFSQTGTVTGRLSSSGPNLQNIPARGARGKKVRGLFEAPEGKVLVVGDYDQLEMRLMAHFSGDARLTRIFREGRDPHIELAYAIFGSDIDPNETPAGAACSYRDAAKTLNYAMGYGAGPKKVAQTLSLLGWPTTKEVAEGYLAEMARFYAGLFRWKAATIRGAKRRGSVRTLGGHRRRLRGAFKDTANWKAIGYGERQAVNAIVQGSAADIIRRVMVVADAQFPELSMLAQVHDELVWEAYPQLLTDVLPELEQVAEQGHGFKLDVPLMFEPHVGHTWAAAKSGVEVVELLEELGDDE